MKKNILLFLTIFFLSLLAAEFALRLIYPETVAPPEKEKQNWAIIPERVWTEYHPTLGWYHEKNKSAHLVKENSYDVLVTTNAAGFRGSREYALQQPANVHRLIALGDSFVFGFGVHDFEAFPSLLEKRFSNLEAINLGVAGYGLDQILMAYRTIAKNYSANYVMIGIFREDFWRCTRAFNDAGHIKPYFSLEKNGTLKLHNVPVPPRYSMKTGQFPQIIYSPLWETALLNTKLYRMLKRAFLKLGKNLRAVDPDTTEEWILGKAILKELIEEIRRDGRTPFLVIVPPEGWARDTKPTSLEKSIVRLSKQEKVDLINLTTSLREIITKASITDYYIKDDWHWTAKGHALVADIVAEYLNSKLPLTKTKVP